MGPYKILQKISSNASVLDLLEDIGTSNIFYIEDLTLYLGHIDTFSIDAPTLQPQFPQFKKTLNTFWTIVLFQLVYVTTKNIW